MPRIGRADVCSEPPSLGSSSGSFGLSIAYLIGLSVFLFLICFVGLLLEHMVYKGANSRRVLFFRVRGQTGYCGWCWILSGHVGFFNMHALTGG